MTGPLVADVAEAQPTVPVPAELANPNDLRAVNAELRRQFDTMQQLLCKGEERPR